MRAIDADVLIADCQLAQKQADRHGREFANAFYSGGGEVSTEWWCVEDMIENAPTIEPEIVRCKNCKYNSNTCGNYVNCDIIPQMFGRTADNFCSMAERRTDEE